MEVRPEDLWEDLDAIQEGLTEIYSLIVWNGNKPLSEDNKKEVDKQLNEIERNLCLVREAIK